MKSPDGDPKANRSYPNQSTGPILPVHTMPSSSTSTASSAVPEQPPPSVAAAAAAPNPPAGIFRMSPAPFHGLFSNAGAIPPSSPPFRRQYGSGPKERLRLLLDEPNSSPLAFWTSVLIAITIVMSSVTAIIETVPAYYRSQEQLWIVFEACVVGVFTVEFAIRCYAHSSTWRQFWKYCRSFYTIIDLVAIAPFYLSAVFVNTSSSNTIVTSGGTLNMDAAQLISRHLQSGNLDGMINSMAASQWSDMQRFTVLRLFRLLRLFRCYTFSSLLQLSIDALIMSLRKSVDALLALFVFLSFIMVAFSTLMYFAERGTWDPIRREFLDVTGGVSQFSSIPDALWFVAEIMTTVGLGDVYPKTTLGKTIVIPLMMFSLLIIALPSIVIGRNFAESWAWLRSTRPTGAGGLRSATLTATTGSIGGGIVHSDGLLATSLAIPAASDAVGSQGGGGGGGGVAEPAPVQPSVERESQFLAELSSTQLAKQMVPVELGGAEQIPLPAPSTDIGEHGEVMLGILQELQRQNELLERLVLAAHVNATGGGGATHSLSPLGAQFRSRANSFASYNGGGEAAADEGNGHG